MRQPIRDYDVDDRPTIVETSPRDEGGMGMGVVLGVILAIVIAGALVWMVIGSRGFGTTTPTAPVQPSNPTINVNPPSVPNININPPAQQPQNNGGNPAPSGSGQSQGNGH